MKQIVTLVAAVLAALGLVLATASTALASVGPRFFSAEQAGYAATGADFKFVQTSVKLPDASQFATNVAGFGFSVQLRTKFRVVVLGLSNTTTPGDYSAAVAVFNRTTHSLICSTASASKPCPNVPSGWTSGKVSFPPGDTVFLVAQYRRAIGVDQFFVSDQTSGVQLFYGGYAPGTGKLYRQARVGAEFAADPFSTFAYTPPGTETHLVTFKNCVLITYGGSISSFTSSWTRHKVITTSDGTSTGTVEVRPHGLFNFGQNFGVFLEP